jgi:hypothetical protein
MRTIFAMIAASIGCAATSAADNGVYLGAGVGRSDFDLQNALDNSDHGLKLIAGVRLLDSFGLELNYADHGKASLPTGVACVAVVGVNCPTTANVKTRTTSGFAVAFVDFPLLDLFGKAGLSLSDARLRASGLPTFGFSDKNAEFAWGFGAQAHFGSFGARAEYEQFKFFGVQDLKQVSVSVVYTIL